jgi:hypothetical protein
MRWRRRMRKEREERGRKEEERGSKNFSGKVLRVH